MPCVHGQISLSLNTVNLFKVYPMSSASSTLTNSATLPDGYTQRPALLSDAEAVARLYTGVAHARGEEALYTAELIASRWQNPPCDLATSSQVFLNPQGEIAACIALW